MTWIQLFRNRIARPKKKGIGRLIGLIAVVLFAGSVIAEEKEPGNSNLTPEEAYRQLVAGNARYIKQLKDGSMKLPDLSSSEDRFPVATILYSSDLAQKPNVLTDLSERDLYMLPIKLGAFSKDNLGDFDYGIMNLRTPVAVVLTHTPSRDILNFIREFDVLESQASAESKKTFSTEENKEKKLTANQELYNLVGPAIKRSREAYPNLQGEELAAVVSEALAWQSLEAILMQSNAATSLIKAGSLDLIAAIVDDSTGRINWLGAHPLQDEFLKPVPEDVQNTLKKIQKDPKAVKKEDLPNELDDVVIDNYIEEYQNNNYYTNVIQEYYVDPCYYTPYWSLFRHRCWSYRPWFGISVGPFVPFPNYYIWGAPPVFAGWGYHGWWIGFNFFGPPVHYGPGFRPFDPWWGRPIYHGHGPGPAPFDPIRRLIYDGGGRNIRPLPPDHRPGFHPGERPIGPGGPGRPNHPGGPGHPNHPDGPGRPNHPDGPGRPNHPGGPDRPIGPTHPQGPASAGTASPRVPKNTVLGNTVSPSASLGGNKPGTSGFNTGDKKGQFGNRPEIGRSPNGRSGNPDSHYRIGGMRPTERPIGGNTSDRASNSGRPGRLSSSQPINRGPSAGAGIGGSTDRTPKTEGGRISGSNRPSAGAGIGGSTDRTPKTEGGRISGSNRPSAGAGIGGSTDRTPKTEGGRISGSNRPSAGAGIGGSTDRSGQGTERRNIGTPGQNRQPSTTRPGRNGSRHLTIPSYNGGGRLSSDTQHREFQGNSSVERRNFQSSPSAFGSSNLFNSRSLNETSGNSGSMRESRQYPSSSRFGSGVNSRSNNFQRFGSSPTGRSNGINTGVNQPNFNRTPLSDRTPRASSEGIGNRAPGVNRSFGGGTSNFNNTPRFNNATPRNFGGNSRPAGAAPRNFGGAHPGGRPAGGPRR